MYTDRRPQLFFHLRRLKSVRRILGREVTVGLVWQLCQLLWQPGLTTVTPSSQDFLRRQSIHFIESRTQLPDLLLELGHAESHHSCSQKPALASDQAVHTIETVRACAPCAHRSQSCLPGWHDNCHRRSTPGRERLRSANSFRYETPQMKLKFGERSF